MRSTLHASTVLTALCHVGSACFNHNKTFTYIQSRFYRAPEILLGLPYSSAIDMFSLGCILVELHTGRPLFDGNCEADQVIKQYDVLGCPPHNMLHNNTKAAKFYDCIIEHGTAHYVLRSQPSPKCIRKYNNSVRAAIGDKWQNTELYYLFEDFVTQMLQYDPEKRIKPAQALNHQFLQAVANASGTAQQHNSTATVTSRDSVQNVTVSSTVTTVQSTITHTTMQQSTHSTAVNTLLHNAVAPPQQPIATQAQYDTSDTTRSVKRPLAQLTKHKTWSQPTNQPIRATATASYHDVAAIYNVPTDINTFSPNSTSSTVCNSVSSYDHHVDPLSSTTQYSPVTPVVSKQYTVDAHAEVFVLPPTVQSAAVRPVSTQMLSHHNSQCNTPGIIASTVFTQHRDQLVDSAQTSDGEDDSDTASVVQRAMAVQSDSSNGNKKLRTVFN